MKTYNETIVRELRTGTCLLTLSRISADVANVIEQQDQQIKDLEEDFQEALEISKISVATMKIAANRILELEKALYYIHNNPHAHPENVKWVVKDALGTK